MDNEVNDNLAALPTYFIERYSNITGLDLNNIKTTGFYLGYNVANASSAGAIAIYLVQAYSPDWVYQEEKVINNNGTVTRKYRTFYGGTTWGTWNSL